MNGVFSPEVVLDVLAVLIASHEFLLRFRQFVPFLLLWRLFYHLRLLVHLLIEFLYECCLVHSANDFLSDL